MSYDENNNLVYFAEIQMKSMFFWHTVVMVYDEDEEYVENRADEIIGILENPNT